MWLDIQSWLQGHSLLISGVGFWMISSLVLGFPKGNGSRLGRFVIFLSYILPIFGFFLVTAMCFVSRCVPD